MALPNLRRSGSIVPLRRDENQSNGVVRIDPWNDFAVMNGLLENFFQNPFYTSNRSGSSSHSVSETQIELYETDDELIAFMFAPGLDSTTLDISATAEQLSISGERKPRFNIAEKTIKHTPWVSNASSSGTFSAAFTLPVQIDTDKVNAMYRDGILEIHLGKPEAVKPKQVKVQLS